MEHLIAGGFESIEAAVEAASFAQAALASPARQWLALARAVAPALELTVASSGRESVFSLQPCLRDARPEHFLFERDRLSGIVDFGAMGVDCVAGDLARLIGDWLDGDPALRAPGLAAYERIRPLEPAEISARSRLRVLGRPLDRRAMAPLAFPRRPPLRRSRGRLERPARGLKRLERLALEIKRGQF